MHKIQPLFQLDTCTVMIEEWLCIYATSTKFFMNWSIHDYIFECFTGGKPRNYHEIVLT